jgi:hypothetical protein
MGTNPGLEILRPIVGGAGHGDGGGADSQFGWPFWLATAVSVLWILTVVNAFNFSDNMNGLCAGLAILGGLCLGLGLAAKETKRARCWLLAPQARLRFFFRGIFRRPRHFSEMEAVTPWAVCWRR